MQNIILYFHHSQQSMLNSWYDPTLALDMLDDGFINEFQALIINSNI